MNLLAEQFDISIKELQTNSAPKFTQSLSCPRGEIFYVRGNKYVTEI